MPKELIKVISQVFHGLRPVSVVVFFSSVRCHADSSKETIAISRHFDEAQLVFDDVWSHLSDVSVVAAFEGAITCGLAVALAGYGEGFIGFILLLLLLTTLYSLLVLFAHQDFCLVNLMI